MEDYFFDNLPSPVALNGGDDIDYLEELGTLFRLFDVVNAPQEENFSQKYEDKFTTTDDNSEEFEENVSSPSPPDVEFKVFDEDDSNNDGLFFPGNLKFNNTNYRKNEIPFSGVTESFVEKNLTSNKFDPEEDDELENDECNSTYEGDDLDDLEDDSEVEGFQIKRVQPRQQIFQMFEVPRGNFNSNNNAGNNIYPQSSSQFVPHDFFPPQMMMNDPRRMMMRNNNQQVVRPKMNPVTRFQQPRRITGLSHQISMREYFSQFQKPVMNVCKIWSPRPLQTYSFDVMQNNNNNGRGRMSGGTTKSGLGEGMIQDSVLTVLSERTDANKHLFVSYNSDFLDQVVLTEGGWENVRLFGFMREIYLTKERKVVQKFQSYHKNNGGNNSVVPPPPFSFNNNNNNNNNNSFGGRRRRRRNDNIKSSSSSSSSYYSSSNKSGLSSPEDQFMIRESETNVNYVASYQNFLRMNKSILRTPSERVARANSGSEYRFEVSLDRFNMNLVKVNPSSRLFAKRPFVEFALVLESARCVVVSLFCFKYHGKETKRGQSKKELRLSSFVFPKNSSDLDLETVFKDFTLGQERLWTDGDDEGAYSFQSSFVSKLDYERYNDVHGGR